MLVLLFFACRFLCSVNFAVKNEFIVRANLTIANQEAHSCPLFLSKHIFHVLDPKMLCFGSFPLYINPSKEDKNTVLWSVTSKKVSYQEASSKILVFKFVLSTKTEEEKITLFRIIDMNDCSFEGGIVKEVYDLKAFKRYFDHFLSKLIMFFKNKNKKYNLKKINRYQPLDYEILLGLQKIHQFIIARKNFFKSVAEVANRSLSMNNECGEDCVPSSTSLYTDTNSDFKKIFEEARSLFLNNACSKFNETPILTLEEFNTQFDKIRNTILKGLKNICDYADLSSLNYTLYDPDIIIDTRIYDSITIFNPSYNEKKRQASSISLISFQNNNQMQIPANDVIKIHYLNKLIIPVQEIIDKNISIVNVRCFDKYNAVMLMNYDIVRKMVDKYIKSS
ncbi:hypothetical protein NGRA_1884 [Nosema granulosis]|uniref:Uncharacterized protein n=1 Tax=Nosema granulosis TaxID=83296 RepID=A0A9P6GZ74_9MICR|nr:hypothetical protein NGRA_1884 [Nosema granulosis]